MINTRDLLKDLMVLLCEVAEEWEKSLTEEGYAGSEEKIRSIYDKTTNIILDIINLPEFERQMRQAIGEFALVREGVDRDIERFLDYIDNMSKMARLGESQLKM